MEVSHQCRKRGLALRADWYPRLENQEADDLTNLEFKSFNHAKWLDVRLEDLEFGVLRDLFEVGDKYLAEIENLKTQAKETKLAKAGRKRKLAGDSLRERDPW